MAEKKEEQEKKEKKVILIKKHHSPAEEAQKESSEKPAASGLKKKRVVIVKKKTPEKKEPVVAAQPADEPSQSVAPAQVEQPVEKTAEQPAEKAAPVAEKKSAPSKKAVAQESATSVESPAPKSSTESKASEEKPADSAKKAEPAKPAESVKAVAPVKAEQPAEAITKKSQETQGATTPKKGEAQEKKGTAQEKAAPKESKPTTSEAPAAPEVAKKKSADPVKTDKPKKTVIKKPLGMVDRTGLDPTRAPGRIVNKPFVQQHLQNAQRNMQQRDFRSRGGQDNRSGGGFRGPARGGARPGGPRQDNRGGFRGPAGGPPRDRNGGPRAGGGFAPVDSGDPSSPYGKDNRGSTSRHGKGKSRQVYNKKNKYQENLDKINLSKKTVVMQNPVPKEIDILENITISELAKKMNLKSSEIMQKLMSMGEMVSNMNQQIDAETATLVADEYSCKVNIVSLYDETVIESHEVAGATKQERAPIVTVMGHVDHGKTKLLDTVRKSDVVAGEFGGITQHIGAYKIHHGEKEIVFLDTPGHAAFTMMRARGAQVTDVVVLVVAANDGVMPQTVEAIHHAKEADVPIIVAVNKIDLPEANPDRVKQQLSEHDLLPEDWGGSTMFCEVSALTGLGIDDLLESILLQTEVMELEADYDCRAEGKVLESRMDQGRGNVADVVIQRGTLNVGDPFVAGIYAGKVRAIFNDRGERIASAGPSTPVEVTGLTGLPGAGTPFQVTENEKMARQIGAKRQELERHSSSQRAKVSLDNLFATIQEGSIQVLKVIIKSDVAGSAEALKMTLEELSTDEIKLSVIHASPGPIVENDVTLASASDAILIGFNVRPTPQAQQLAEREKVEIRKYNVIYDAVDEMKLAMEGMLEPDYREDQIGTVEVRETFKVPKIGIIAGCYVTQGMVKRNSTVRVIRDNIEIHSGKISSLKRMKDDAKSVVQDFECGIGIENYQDLAVGDILEVVEMVEIKKTL